MLAWGMVKERHLQLNIKILLLLLTLSTYQIPGIVLNTFVCSSGCFVHVFNHHNNPMIKSEQETKAQSLSKVTQLISHRGGFKF
jgi:hypothetical protein